MSDKCVNTGELELCRAIKTVWYWRRGGDSFSCMLIDLAHNSPEKKREKLFMGFPYLRLAYRKWKNRKTSERGFFLEHELEFEEQK